MKPLTKKAAKEMMEDVFDRKLEPFAKATQLEFQRIDDKFSSFVKYVQLEFQRVDQRFLDIGADIRWLKNSFNQAFGKLDKFMSMYKDNKQEITMLIFKGERLDNKIDSLDKRVTKLES